jgi:hypothetical protein
VIGLQQFKAYFLEIQFRFPEPLQESADSVDVPKLNPDLNLNPVDILARLFLPFGGLGWYRIRS